MPLFSRLDKSVIPLYETLDRWPDSVILNRMARKRAGKPLTFRPIRVDDDVWQALQVLKDEYRTINEGLRVKLLPFEGRKIPTSEEVLDKVKKRSEKLKGKWGPLDKKYARGLRQKGDKTR